MRENKYKQTDLDTQKNEIIEEIENVENNDLEDIIFRLELT